MTEYIINEEIKANKVLLINADGVKIGILPKNVALQKCYDAQLDLVCINNTSNPVVCKMMDYNKYKFDRKKKEKELKAQQKKEETHELQFRPVIQEHDLDTKLKKAKEFLENGDKVKFVVAFKGRDVTHPDLGYNLLAKIKEKLSDVAEVVKDGKLEGKRIEIIMSKKKQ